MTGPVTHSIHTNENSTSSATGEGHVGLQDGILLRDVPKRTTFYDLVAERQMSQTDAKLFYQRSKVEADTGIGNLRSQTSRSDSPTVISTSRPFTEYGPTEYGPDRSALDHDGGV